MYEDANEDWRSIPTYPKYMISNKGRLYSIAKDKTICYDKHGGVTLYNDQGHKGWSIQVLMGCVFLGNDINDPCRNRVLFKDGDSTNFNLDNLYIEDTSDLPGEEWRPIKEAAGRKLKAFYVVSNLGRIKSLKHSVQCKNHSKIINKPCPELIISCYKEADGYYMAYLACENGTEVNAQVHRLVAQAFCENDDPENKIQVNHIDGNPSNNCASNLEWCTPSENCQHAIRTGLKGNHSGRRLRYPVRRLETNILYNSISDVDRAMGRCVGYTDEAMKHGHTLTDINGEVWTIEVFKDLKVKVRNEGQHCYIEELPGKEFISLSQASSAIGRWEGYISDAIQRGSKISSKDKKVVHFHFVDPEMDQKFQSGEFVLDKYKNVSHPNPYK